MSFLINKFSSNEQKDPHIPIILGEPSVNRGFPSNRVQTAQYQSFFHLLTWGLLWLIFKSLASIYFFTVGLLQLLTPWSPTGKFTTIGPYTFNKLFEMANLYWDNKKHMEADFIINERIVHVINQKERTTRKRQDLVVGDLICVKDGEIPVDMVLIHSVSGDVFTDHRSLTGEKDPLQRVVVPNLRIEYKKEFPAIHGTLYITEPNPDLEKFAGTLCIGKEKYHITADNTLLEGSHVLKGENVHGVVFATGKNTKIRSKQTKVKQKLSHLEKRLNIITSWTIGCLMLLICFGTLGHIITFSGEAYNISQVLISYFLLFNGLIAQTVQFSLEVTRRFQAIQIKQDGPDVLNNSSVDEVGLTEAIIFDKTGTLTCNTLQPKEFHVKGKAYKIDPNSNISYEDISPDFNWLLLCICLNNTVFTESSSDSYRPIYFGTSADEVALLESLFQSIGYYIQKRTISLTTITGEEIFLNGTKDEKDSKWQIIYLYKYSSSKGYMSVICQNEKTEKVYLIAKGSPEKIYQILRKDQIKFAEEQVTELASQGLRVFLYSSIEIDWNATHPDDLLDGAAMEAYRRQHENGMLLVGATGTEDKLQPNLVQTIKVLQNANIKTIMCTGDIKLTAKNIGESSGMLRESKIFDISIISDEPLDQQMKNVKHTDGQKSILVGKDEMEVILCDKNLSSLFLDLIRTCRAVITYRAGPSMKGDLTRFLKRSGLITMTVGDGANDIEMIREAHIGVGIRGGENTHAADSSEIAISKIEQLPGLILNHGRRNFHRNSRMTLMIMSMKMTVVLSLLFFDWYHGFKIESIYSQQMLLSYNLFYGWAALVFGILHTPFKQKDKLNFPLLQKKDFGIESLSFNELMKWWGRAALEALIIMILCVWYFNDEQAIPFLLNEKSKPMQIANFIVIMFLVNIRVCFYTDNVFVYGATFLTLFAFCSLIIVPAWTFLTPTIVWFVASIITLYTLGNILFNMIEKNSSFHNGLSGIEKKIH